MASRPETLSVPKKPPAAVEENLPEPIGQRRPTQERYRLQVDRQTKSSHATFEAAEKLGLAIKKKHPIVQIAVYDAVESTNTIVDVKD